MWFANIPYFARKNVIHAHTRQPFFMCYDSYTILLGIISFGRKLFPFDRKLFLLTGNYFSWQEIILLGRKLFHLAGNFFHLAGNYFPWQEIISLDRKLFHLAGIYFVWQGIISFKKIWFPSKEVSSYKKLLPSSVPVGNFVQI